MNNDKSSALILGLDGAATVSIVLSMQKFNFLLQKFNSSVSNKCLYRGAELRKLYLT